MQCFHFYSLATFSFTTLKVNTSQNLPQWKWEQVRKIFATYFKSLDGPFHMQFCFWFLQYYAFWTLKKYVKLTSIMKLHPLHQGSQLNLLSCPQSSSVPRNLTMTPRKSCTYTLGDFEQNTLNPRPFIKDIRSFPFTPSTNMNDNEVGTYQFKVYTKNPSTQNIWPIYSSINTSHDKRCRYNKRCINCKAPVIIWKLCPFQTFRRLYDEFEVVELFTTLEGTCISLQRNEPVGEWIRVHLDHEQQLLSLVFPLHLNHVQISFTQKRG